MKTILSIFCFSIVFVSAVRCSDNTDLNLKLLGNRNISKVCPSTSPSASSFTPKNIWVWRNSLDVINDPDARKTFFKFADEQNIKAIYVNVKSMLERYGSENSEKNTESNLIDFISIASSKCMDVQMLVGNKGTYVSEWEAANGYPSMTKIAQNAREYVAGVTGPKPAAIHWDVEPQGLSDFKNGSDSTKRIYLQRLINGFQKTRSILEDSGIKQAEDIAHWWDGDPYINMSCDPYNDIVSPKYSDKTAHACLLRVLDQIDIMDYWDQTDRIICQAGREIRGKIPSFCGSSVTESSNNVINFNDERTMVAVGQETQDLGSSSDERGQTYYDELRSLGGNHCSGDFTGTECMEKNFQAIQHELNKDPGFAGHGLESKYDADTPRASFYQRPPPGVPAGISLHHYDDYNASTIGIIKNFP